VELKKLNGIIRKVFMGSVAHVTKEGNMVWWEKKELTEVSYRINKRKIEVL
jgi:hypothetical protein